MSNKVDEVTMVAARIAGGGAIFGMTPAEYAAVCTALYFLVQTAYVLWKWRKEGRADVDKK